jgi:hypothetical protein
MMWGYDGLGTLLRAAFQRPFQIVRQTISLCETQRKAGQRRISNIPIGITNLYILVWQTLGYKGLKGLKVWQKFGLKKVWFFYFGNWHPVRVS